MIRKTFFKKYLLVILALASLGIINNVDASPSFPERSIDGDSLAYFPENYFEYETNALSLDGVFYNSDGKTLDATLILNGKSGFEINNIISYGMLIDTDTDFSTGLGGFDYRYRIQWNNGTWYEIYEKLPTFGTPKNLEPPRNINNVFTPDVLINNQVKSTAELQLDLTKIGNPDHYSIAFFTEGNMEGKTPLIQDVLGRAVVPPINFANFLIYTHPSPLSFASSTEKDVHIFLESTFTDNAKIYYNIRTNVNETSIKRASEDISDSSIVLQGGKAEIPILLKDKGHDDIQVHQLYVDLSPWYQINPKTEHVERGGEIYQSYHFRNPIEVKTFTILWTSLPQPPLMDFQTLVQVVMLVFTIIAAMIGSLTYLSNSDFNNYLRNDKHKRQILIVYDLMLLLVSKVEHNTKQLTLKYPTQEDEKILVQAGTGDLGIRQTRELEEFDGKMIPLYGSALKHLKSYPDLNKKWQDIQNIIKQYNGKVKLLKNDIRQICLNAIHEKLPNFREDDGNEGSVFLIDNIQFEAYGVLEDAMHGEKPRTSLNEYVVPLIYQYNEETDEEINEGIEYHASLSVTLFRSPKQLPDEIHAILGYVLEDSLKEQYKSLMELEQKSQSKLDIFRIGMTKLVRDLNTDIQIEGKCELDYGLVRSIKKRLPKFVKQK